MSCHTVSDMEINTSLIARECTSSSGRPYRGRWLLGLRTACGRDQDPTCLAQWLTQVKRAPVWASTTLLARRGFRGTPALPATAVQANLDALVRIAELFQEVLKSGTLRGDDHQVAQGNLRRLTQHAAQVIREQEIGRHRIGGTLSGPFCTVK